MFKAYKEILNEIIDIESNLIYYYMVVMVHCYIHLVKCEQNKVHPYSYIGYLLMEYFPLGSITDNLKKFQRCENHEGLKTLSQLSQEIEEIEWDMREKESETDEEFGKFRHQWCALKRQKEKVASWCQHIIQGVMETVRRLHERKLMHLDIKGIYCIKSQLKP